MDVDAAIQIAGCDNAQRMNRTLASLLFVPLAVLLLGAAAKPAAPPPPPPDLDRAPADAQSLGIPGFLVKQLAPPTSDAVLADDDYVRIRYVIWASPPASTWRSRSSSAGTAP